MRKDANFSGKKLFNNPLNVNLASYLFEYIMKNCKFPEIIA